MKYKIKNFFTKYKHKFIGLYQQWIRGWSYYNEDGNFVDFDYFILDVIFPRFADEWEYTRDFIDYSTNAKDRKAKKELDKVYDWYKKYLENEDELWEPYQDYTLRDKARKETKEMAITLMKYNEYISW